MASTFPEKSLWWDQATSRHVVVSLTWNRSDLNREFWRSSEIIDSFLRQPMGHRLYSREMVREGHIGIPHGLGLGVVITLELEEAHAVRQVVAGVVAFGVAEVDAT